MNNTLRIVDALGNDCSAGTRGEIIVMGPSVTAGYWDEPELTAATVVDGWLHTGDQGYVDDDGFLFVSGRIKDMIISGGMNIFPSEIEETLIEHPDIAAVAVIGVPDERWGERVHAVVQLLPGRSLSEADVIAYCTERIAGFKKPQSVVFVEEFPRTASGKIQKYMLRRSGHDTGSAS
jgi:fatty-acyl-CoA synthase